MTLTRMALVLAAAGFATGLYLNARRRGVGPGGAAASAARRAPARGTVVRAVTGAGSPDDVVLLRSRGFAETPPR